MTSPTPPTPVGDKSDSDAALAEAPYVPDRSLTDDVIESRDLATSGDVSGSSLSDAELSARARRHDGGTLEDEVRGDSMASGWRTACVTDW